MGIRTSSSLIRVFSSWLVGVPQTGGGGNWKEISKADGEGGEGRAWRRDFETRRGQSLESSSSPSEEREGLLLMMKVAWRGIGGRWLIPPLETSVFPQYFRRMQGNFRQLVG